MGLLFWISKRSSGFSQTSAIIFSIDTFIAGLNTSSRLKTYQELYVVTNHMQCVMYALVGMRCIYQYSEILTVDNHALLDPVDETYRSMSCLFSTVLYRVWTAATCDIASNLNKNFHTFPSRGGGASGGSRELVLDGKQVSRAARLSLTDRGGRGCTPQDHLHLA